MVVADPSIVFLAKNYKLPCGVPFVIISGPNTIFMTPPAVIILNPLDLVFVRISDFSSLKPTGQHTSALLVHVLFIL